MEANLREETAVVKRGRKGREERKMIGHRVEEIEKQGEELGVRS